MGIKDSFRSEHLDISSGVTRRGWLSPRQESLDSRPGQRQGRAIPWELLSAVKTLFYFLFCSVIWSPEALKSGLPCPRFLAYWTAGPLQMGPPAGDLESSPGCYMAQFISVPATLHVALRRPTWLSPGVTCLLGLGPWGQGGCYFLSSPSMSTQRACAPGDDLYSC